LTRLRAGGTVQEVINDIGSYCQRLKHFRTNVQLSQAFYDAVAEAAKYNTIKLSSMLEVLETCEDERVAILAKDADRCLALLFKKKIALQIARDLAARDAGFNDLDCAQKIRRYIYRVLNDLDCAQKIRRYIHRALNEDNDYVMWIDLPDTLQRAVQIAEGRWHDNLGERQRFRSPQEVMKIIKLLRQPEPAEVS
jgi:hypothetical protein